MRPSPSRRTPEDTRIPRTSLSFSATCPSFTFGPLGLVTDSVTTSMLSVSTPAPQTAENSKSPSRWPTIALQNRSLMQPFPGRECHLRVDWVGESFTRSITLCGLKGEAMGAGPTPCPDCAQVDEALNVCGLGPESLRELFDRLQVIGPSEVKAKMDTLGALLDMQDREPLN